MTSWSEVAQQAMRGKSEYDVRLDLLQQESQLLRPSRGVVRNTVDVLGQQFFEQTPSSIIDFQHKMCGNDDQVQKLYPAIRLV